MREVPAVLTLWLAALVPLAGAQPATAPAAAGVSSERLQRLDDGIGRLIAAERMAGAVVLLMRRGQLVHLGAYGQLDREAGTPMSRDAIFRICSMSKPLTSVGAMLLYEEGHFLLDDPVSRWLPELAEPQVLVPGPGGAADPASLVAAERPITIRHLLTHTSGISYRFFGQPPIADLYAAAGVVDGLAESDVELAENVRRIASQPLLHQPGEAHSYGLSTDVLGRLIEVISGVRLGEFLERRVFAPLGMVDTGFSLPDAKLARLAPIYRTDRGPGLAKLAPGVHEEGHVVFSSSYSRAGANRYQSGGAGLVSTAADYARFASMLLNRGELDGHRLLSRKTVELMTADHLARLDPWPGFGFGLGLSLSPDPGRSGQIVSEGTWGWGGFYTTRFWIDPREELVGVVMTQVYPYDSGELLERLQALAYQAIAD